MKGHTEGGTETDGRKGNALDAGGKEAGSEGVLGVYLGERQIVLMCLSLSVFFSCLLPSTPLLIDREEEEERDEEGWKYF